MFDRILQSMTLNPQRLFLIDGLGALLSAFLLGVVLVQLQEWIGMPVNSLYFLAFLPCLFALYDAYCFFRVKENIAFFIRGIALANLSYCLISIGLALQHYQVLTTLGWAYFIIEILIVVALVAIEWATARRL